MSEKNEYLITQTKTIRIDAVSAAEARKIGENLLLLNPHSKLITITVHVERVRN